MKKSKSLTKMKRLAQIPNPFTDEYVKQEVAFYGKPELKAYGDVRFRMVKPQGRLDDFLNKNMRFMEFEVPHLTIGDDGVWMSLTPMEVQSSCLAIHRAHGVVGTAGLGLGYYALRCAAKKEVEHVHVWEINKDVIEWFMRSFKKRKELKKITVYHSDIRKLKDWCFDWFFMDVYQTMLPDEVIKDSRSFQKKNRCVQYLWWTWEMTAVAMILMRKMRTLFLPSDMMQLIRHWMSTDFGTGDGTALVNLEHCTDYCSDMKFTRPAFNAAKLSFC